MPIYLRWLCLCLCLAGLVPAADPPAFALKRVDARSGIAAFETGDIDSDGRIEAIELATDHYRFWVREFSREAVIGPAIYQVTSQYYINYVAPIEIDTTPGMELAISYNDQMADSAWLCIIAGADKERVLCQTEAVHGINLNDRDAKLNPGWDGSIGQCYAVDLNNDGVREIVLSVGVGFDLYPRGLYVYQYPSGRLLWRFLTAGNLSSVAFGDANSDGYVETFLKTSASANGAIIGDQSDTTADIFALNHAGGRLWRMKMGDRFEFHTCNIQVGDYDNDGMMDIYYGVLLRSDDFDRQVQVLEKHRAADNQYLQQHSFDAGHRFVQLTVGRLDGDSLPKLILDNGPTILDPRTLTTISEGPFPQGDIAYIGDLGPITAMPDNVYVGNLNPEATTAAAIIRKGDSLHIVDGNFRLLASYGAEYGRNIGTVRYFHSPVGGDYLGVLADAGEVEKPGSILYILRIEPANGAVVSSWWRGGGASWVFVVLAFLLGMPAGIVLMKLLVRKPQVHPDRNLAQYRDLLSALTTFGHGQMAGRNLTRLAFLFSNLPEAPKKIEEIRPNIRSAVEAYRSFTGVQIENIIKDGRGAPVLGPLIKELTHQAMQLSIVLGDADPSQLSTKDLLSLKTAIPKKIEVIRRCIKQIESTIMPLFGSDLIKVFPMVLSGLAGHLRQQGVGLSAISIIGGHRHRVLFPETELSALFEEIITNACTAMKESATKWISLKLEHTIDQVIIEISDTGPGLKVDDPEILFSRQYSTKGPEGGYGLYLARQQIERFGGKIRIRNNTDGPGATVQLIFKAVPLE